MVVDLPGRFLVRVVADSGDCDEPAPGCETLSPVHGIGEDVRVGIAAEMK